MPRKFIRRDVLAGVATTAALATSPARALASTAKIHEVKIKSFEFEPKTVSVEVGDIVRWTNEDIAPHTATADEGGWDTGEIAKDKIGEIWVNADMGLNYFCAFHPHMKGKIVLA